MPIPVKQALEDRAARHDDLIASGPQVEMIFPRGQKTLSLRAQKIWHLLVKKAGVRLGDETLHRIPVAELYEIGHMPQAARVEAMRELQRTLVEVVTSREDKTPQIESSGLLAYVARNLIEGGIIEFEFGRALRTVFANSDHWAILSKRAVFAFESRYSLRLYEILALRVGLDHKTSEIFDLETLRDRFGVPLGKLERWTHFRQFALEPAIAEVNQLAGFNVAYEPIKRGRSVAAVKLTWGEKSPPERKATKRELDGSKVGRKARRKGAVEQIVEPVSSLPPKPVGFPSDGSISYSKWSELARQHAPKPTPDIDMIASAFRKWAHEKAMPLQGEGVEKAFIGFCKKFKASV